MECGALAPWSPHQLDWDEWMPNDDYLYFHRDALGDDPSCVLCIWREKPGHWAVVNIVPDEG